MCVNWYEYKVNSKAHDEFIKYLSILILIIRQKFRFHFSSSHGRNSDWLDTTLCCAMYHKTNEATISVRSYTKTAKITIINTKARESTNNY